MNMISEITIQSIIIFIVIGALGLISVIFINKRSNKFDKSMYDKKFNAKHDLKSYKADSIEREPDIEKKLNKFKMKGDE